MPMSLSYLAGELKDAGIRGGKGREGERRGGKGRKREGKGGVRMGGCYEKR